MSSGRVVSYQLSEEQRAAVREQVRKQRAAAFKKRRAALEAAQHERLAKFAPTVSAPVKLAEVERGRRHEPAAQQKAAAQQKPTETEDRERTRARECADKSLARLAAADIAGLADSADLEIRRLRGLIDTEDPALLPDLLDQIDADVQRICERRQQQAKLEGWSVTVQAVRDDARAVGLKDEAERLAQRLERAAIGVAGDDPRTPSELDDLEREARGLEEGYESLLADARALDLISKVWAEQGYEVLRTDDHRSFLAHRTTRDGASFEVSSTGGVLRAEMVETSKTGAATLHGRRQACDDAAAVEDKAALLGIKPAEIRVEDPEHVLRLRRVPVAGRKHRTRPTSSAKGSQEREAGLGR